MVKLFRREGCIEGKLVRKKEPRFALHCYFSSEVKEELCINVQKVPGHKCEEVSMKVMSQIKMESSPSF